MFKNGTLLKVNIFSFGSKQIEYQNQTTKTNFSDETHNS